MYFSNQATTGTLGFFSDQNRREQKGTEKDSQQQLKMFKQLHEEVQSVGQIFMRSPHAENGRNGGSIMGNRFVGYSHGVGQKGGQNVNGTKSLDAMLQQLRTKADQKTMKMDQTTENESRAFFASKNVDLGSLEYSLRNAQNTFTQLQSKQKLPSKTSLIPSTSNLIQQQVLQAQTTRIGTKSYQQQLISTVPLKGKGTQDTLAKSFTNKIQDQFKAALGQLKIGEGLPHDRQIVMPPFRQFSVKPRDEEEKVLNFAQPKKGFVQVFRDRDHNLIRDVASKSADQDLIEKILKSNVDVVYDETYLKHLTNNQQQGFLPINEPEYRHQFETYATQFKNYAEWKLFSGTKNINIFEQLYFHERDQAKWNFNENQHVFEEHSFFADAWELLLNHQKHLENEKITEDDKILFTDKYQRVIAKSTALFLEEDFKRQVINLAAYDTSDELSKYEQYLQQNIFSKLDEMERSNLKHYVFEEYNQAPFALAFFLYRAGSHQLAINYLMNHTNESVRRFGSYYKDYHLSVPLSQIQTFQSDCENLQDGGADMYRIALTQIMCGQQLQMPNEQIFYEKLVPFELETYFWIRLKIAAYDPKPADFELPEYTLSQIPAGYQAQTLKELQKFITTDLGKEYYTEGMTERSGTLYYFKILMLIGCFSQAIEEINSRDEFRVKATIMSIGMKEIGVLRTRFSFLKLLQLQKDQLKSSYTPAKLHFLLSDCFDYHSQLYSLAYQLSLQNSYTTLTVCLLLFLEDPNLQLKALAAYIVKSGQYKLLLENDDVESFLDFQTNTNLTIRSIIQDEKFKRLTILVTQLNEQHPMINISMMDKLKMHEEVLKYMVKVQREEILRKLPNYFVRGDQNQEMFKSFIRENVRQEINLISNQHAALLNKYEKEGIKKKYAQYYIILDQLEVMANGFNKVWNQQYEEAFTEFTQLNFLPLKKSDSAADKAREYAILDDLLKSLIFDCIITIAKLVRLIHIKITNELSRQGQLTKSAEMRQKQLEEYRDALNKLALYLDLLKSSQAVEPDYQHRINEALHEATRVRIEIA